MKIEISEWKKRVETEPGHDYLYSGFSALLIFQRTQMSNDEAAIVFAEIVRTLGKELYRTLHSLDRCDPVIQKWSKRRFKKCSDEWGQFLIEHGHLGAFMVIDSEIDKHPKCSCGGPHYQFTLSLRHQWHSYVSRCIEALHELVKAFNLAGLRVPIMSEDAVEKWLVLFSTQEKHIGRGAFIAYLEPGIDEITLAQILAETGFELPENEIWFLNNYSSKGDYPPDSSVFAHPNDEVFYFLLTGMAKAKSQVGKKILELFAKDDEPEIQVFSKRLLSEHYGLA